MIFLVFESTTGAKLEERKLSVNALEASTTATARLPRSRIFPALCRHLCCGKRFDQQQPLIGACRQLPPQSIVIARSGNNRVSARRHPRTGQRRPRVYWICWQAGIRRNKRKLRPPKKTETPAISMNSLKLSLRVSVQLSSPEPIAMARPAVGINRPSTLL